MKRFRRVRCHQSRRRRQHGDGDQDPRTGSFAVANRPSDQSTLKLPVLMERPVADVIGIAVDWNAEPPRKKTSPAGAQ